MQDETTDIKPVSAKEGKVAVYDYGMILVSQIEQAHDALWETSSDSDVDTEQLDARTADIYTQVCQETVEGKALFSNDGARKAEAAKRAGADPVIRELKRKIRTNARDTSADKARVEALNNRLKIVIAFLRGDVDVQAN